MSYQGSGLLQEKSHQKLMMSLKSASVTRSIPDATRSMSSQKKSQSKVTSRDHKMHRLVFQDGGLPDGSLLTYVSNGEKLLKGLKRGRAIYCLCCNREVSPTIFEAHAGRASRKKPYENIVDKNGVSLHKYALLLNCNRPSKTNEDWCRNCGNEHASGPSIPNGNGYCMYCKNSNVGQNANALAAGRVSGIRGMVQTTVKNPEKEDLIACVLCRSNDFEGDGFSDWTVIICDQCEKEYHIGCLRQHNKAEFKSLPKDEWFCSMDCVRIHSVLKNILSRGAKKVPESLWALIREKRNSVRDSMGSFDAKWSLIRGQDASPGSNLLLTLALDIFHECFDPIIDPATQSDLIRSMVYGQKVGNQDFAGMHCAILKIDSYIVTAGILRVFGQDVAELPIVATRKCHQGKGYLQVLFACIERLLSTLNVKKIVLPAAREAESLWTNKFGFRKMTPRQLREYRQSCTLFVSFKHTSMLEKEVDLHQTLVNRSLE